MSKGTSLFRALFFECRIPYRYKRNFFVFKERVLLVMFLVSCCILRRRPAIYLGWVGKKNLGDEMLFDAYKKMFPSLYFFPVSEDLFYPIFKFFKFRYVLALGGGTLINQSPDWMDLVKQYKPLCDHSFCIGTGVSDGKMWDNDSIEVWKKVLSGFDHFSFRGPYSVDLIGMGEVAGDSALFLAKDSFYRKKKIKKIGINVSVIEGGKSVIDQDKVYRSVKGLIDLLSDDGWEIVLVPVYPKDEKFMGKFGLRIFKDYLDKDAVFREIESCDVFLGEKLHSCISAAIVRTPFVCIGYQDKCKDFMESMDLMRFCVMDRISSGKLFKLVNGLYEDIVGYQDKIDKKVMEMRGKQVKMVEAVKRGLR